jgi:ParB family chromosome partitioning protein
MTTAAVEKKHEKVEKRRALGRGLASLLPGPRVVVSGGAGAPVAREQATQGLKPEPSMAASATAEAVPFQVSVTDSAVEHPGSQELAATPAPHEVIPMQAQAAQHHVVTQLAVDLIDKNPYQTRYAFDEETLQELADSIKENGVVQPVVVRPAEEQGRFILVLGERRLRASKMAGQPTIPAIVRRLSPQQAAEMTVLENVQREDLNPLEQAEAFRVLSKEFHLTQAQIAERIGVSRETVANYMRLLRLPKEVMGYLLSGRLSFSDCRELLALQNEEHILQVAEEVVTKHLKWDEIEERVARLNGFGPMLPGQTASGDQQKNGRGARWMDPNVRAAQLAMERILGMRVRIKDRNGKGKIVIEYATVDDYERVVEMLKAKSN